MKHKARKSDQIYLCKRPKKILPIKSSGFRKDCKHWFIFDLRRRRSFETTHSFEIEA